MNSKADPLTAAPVQPGAAPLAARLLAAVEAAPAGFHVALDTMDARRLREHPDEVEFSGFVLLDTGEYHPVTARAPLELFWRMQGMDILAHVRSTGRERRARPRKLPASGSVWLVDARLEGSFPALAAGEAPPPAPPCLRICAVHALDRVFLEPRGPRFIETIDTRTMLPKFAAEQA